MSPLESQVREALAIIENGTDYERVHVAAILRNGLAASQPSRSPVEVEGPFGCEMIAPDSEGRTHWRIHDGADNRIATSYVEGNARLIVRALNGAVVGCEQVLANEILAELARARTKFPGDNVTMLALMEEVGELAKATFEESRDRVRKEAVQVATMAMRVVLDGDSTLDGWRGSKGLDTLRTPSNGAGEK